MIVDKKLTLSRVQYLIMYEPCYFAAQPTPITLKGLLPQVDLSTIIICNFFGTAEKRIAEDFLDHSYNLVHLPHQFTGKRHERRRAELAHYNQQHPGERLLVLCGDQANTDHVARVIKDNERVLAVASKGTTSAAINSFNNGQASILAIVRPHIKAVHLNTVDQVINFNIPKEQYVIALQGSATGFIQSK